MTFDEYRAIVRARNQREKFPPNFNYNKISGQVQENLDFNLLPGTKHISVRVQLKD